MPKVIRKLQGNITTWRISFPSLTFFFELALIGLNFRALDSLSLPSFTFTSPNFRSLNFSFLISSSTEARPLLASANFLAMTALSDSYLRFISHSTHFCRDPTFIPKRSKTFKVLFQVKMFSQEVERSHARICIRNTDNFRNGIND